jgi:hypothetical protein
MMFLAPFAISMLTSPPRERRMLDWLGRKNEKVDELVARGRYAQAAAALRREFESGRRDPALRQQLGDVLLLAGRPAEAIPILLGVADELAQAGQTGKAIAALKRVEAAQPGRADVESRLASLLTPATPAAAAEPEKRPPAQRPQEAEGAVFDLEEPQTLLPPVPAIPLFTDLDAHALAALARGFRLIRAEPGDIVVAEGEPGGSLFILTSGLVKAFVKSPRGRYAEVRELGEGEFFGEISVLDGSPRTATITAAARCELLELDQAALQALTSTHPHVRETLARMRDERANSSVESLVRGMRFGRP